MDFGAFPPEVNSARMYAGPGSAPMLAAASAWDGLAAELSSAASGYQSAITGLVAEGWMGPASARMAAAAAPYITWMNTTATQAEHAAAQAKAAAAAYEAAYAMTVPPLAVTANRTQLKTLIATNVLGQNIPAIAATEALYSSMWAQDAAAMYGYAGDAAAASRVAPFTDPPQSTDPAGEANQAAAAAQSAGKSAGSGTQSSLSQAMSTTPDTLQGLASPAQADAHSGFADMLGVNDWFGSDDGTGLSLNSQAWNTLASTGFMDPGGLMEGTSGMGALLFMARAMSLTDMAPAMAGGPGAMFASATGDLGSAGLGSAGLGSAGLGSGGSVSAGVGRATLVGSLSTPPSWTSTAPSVPPAAAPAPGAGVAAGAGGGAPGMPGVPMAGSGSGRGGLGFAAPRYGFKPVVMGRPVVAG